jgi:glycosyltransferase involved in cell wall biosynthesis
VPLMTITMDDPRTFERARPIFARSYDRLLRRIYGDASLSLGVSHEMSSFLEANYGKPSKTFYFGAPDGIIPRPPAESAVLRSPGRLSLGYAGSMSLGYREGIEAIARCLELSGAELRVYSRDQHILVKHPCVRNCGFARPEELWPEVQRTCDAVLLPYAFRGEILDVYRTHFPTKLSEYCWTGLPIVVTGPDVATGLRWAQKHPEAALTATAPMPDILVPLLDRLRDDCDLRVQLAAGAARAARDEFDPGRIQGQFRRCLVDALISN